MQNRVTKLNLTLGSTSSGEKGTTGLRLAPLLCTMNCCIRKMIPCVLVVTKELVGGKTSVLDVFLNFLERNRVRGAQWLQDVPWNSTDWLQWRLVDIFRATDKDGSGKLTHEEVQHILWVSLRMRMLHVDLLSLIFVPVNCRRTGLRSQTKTRGNSLMTWMRMAMGRSITWQVRCELTAVR